MSDSPAPDTQTVNEPTRRAVFVLQSWAGRTEHPCLVVGETPKRYRISVEKSTRLAGRYRYLNPGDTALVPQTAVRFS